MTLSWGSQISHDIIALSALKAFFVFIGPLKCVWRAITGRHKLLIEMKKPLTRSPKFIACTCFQN